jgi:hypothetical protein
MAFLALAFAAARPRPSAAAARIVPATFFRRDISKYTVQSTLPPESSWQCISTGECGRNLVHGLGRTMVPAPISSSPTVASAHASTLTDCTAEPVRSNRRWLRWPSENRQSVPPSETARVRLGAASASFASSAESVTKGSCVPQ